MAAVEAGLPEELLTLILLKLPVKSLLRFMCVKKSWYSLIKSPYFTHLHRSSSSSTSSSSINCDCFIVRRFIKQQNVLSFHSYETLADLGNRINIPTSNNSSAWSNYSSAWLSGSCDGLVCLTDYNDQILVCNPTIREFRPLVFPPPLGKKTDYYIESVAFGSDPNTGQYKLVMIGVPYDDADVDPNTGKKKGVRSARMYDFSTDTWREWRETAVVFPTGPFLYSHSAISFNGAFHWIPCEEWDDKPLLTFHISNEVTGFIPLPDFLDISDDIVDLSYAMELCVSSKSQLSLIFCDSCGWFKICVMTEYGVKESWTSLFYIGPLSDIYQPVAFWGEQSLLLRSEEKGEKGQLVSGDLQHEYLQHEVIFRFMDIFNCIRFLEV